MAEEQYEKQVDFVKGLEELVRRRRKSMTSANEKKRIEAAKELNRYLQFGKKKVMMDTMYPKYGELMELPALLQVAETVEERLDVIARVEAHVAEMEKLMTG